MGDNVIKVDFKKKKFEKKTAKQRKQEKAEREYANGYVTRAELSAVLHDMLGNVVQQLNLLLVSSMAMEDALDEKGLVSKDELHEFRKKVAEKLDEIRKKAVEKFDEIRDQENEEEVEEDIEIEFTED